MPTERPARRPAQPSSRVRRIVRRLPVVVRRPLFAARRRLVGSPTPVVAPAAPADADSPVDGDRPASTGAERPEPAPEPGRPSEPASEPTTTLGEPCPAVWYVPHPDDETIFMGGAIHHNRSADNLVVLLTRGGASKAIDRVNAALDTPIDRQEFMEARLREFRAATGHLGVREDQVVLLDLPDGGIDEASVRQIVRDMEARLPGASHRTMTPTDPHPDHAAVGSAVAAALRAGEITGAVFLVPYPLLDDGSGVRLDHPDPGWTTAKRAALAEYQVWEPSTGRYAVGQHSVRSLLRAQSDDPHERVVPTAAR